MINILDIQLKAKRELARLLSIAEATGQPVAEAAQVITEKLIDFGIENGFFPDEPIEVSSDLKRATATILCCDYTTEATIAV